MKNKSQTNIELDEIVKRVELIEHKKRVKLFWFIIIPILFLFGLVTYNYNETTKNLSLQNKLVNEGTNYDSLENELNTEKAYKVFILEKENESETINEKEILYEYFNFRNNHQVDSMEQFYVDTLENYFFQSKFLKEEATKGDRAYFLEFPEENTQIIEINVVKDGLKSTAFVKTKYSRDGEKYQAYFQEMKLDSFGKIYYVGQASAKDVLKNQKQNNEINSKLKSIPTSRIQPK